MPAQRKRTIHLLQQLPWFALWNCCQLFYSLPFPQLPQLWGLSPMSESNTNWLIYHAFPVKTRDYYSTTVYLFHFHLPQHILFFSLMKMYVFFTTSCFMEPCRTCCMLTCTPWSQEFPRVLAFLEEKLFGNVSGSAQGEGLFNWTR